MPIPCGRKEGVIIIRRNRHRNEIPGYSFGNHSVQAQTLVRCEVSSTRIDIRSPIEAISVWDPKSAVTKRAGIRPNLGDLGDSKGGIRGIHDHVGTGAVDVGTIGHAEKWDGSFFPDSSSQMGGPRIAFGAHYLLHDVATRRIGIDSKAGEVRLNYRFSPRSKWCDIRNGSIAATIISVLRTERKRGIRSWRCGIAAKDVGKSWNGKKSQQKNKLSVEETLHSNPKLLRKNCL